MTAGRLPLFCGTALAERIERAEAQLIAKASAAARRGRPEEAGFALPIAGGVAAFAGAGSPFNKVAGLGFDGVPGPAAWEQIEQAYAAVGAPARRRRPRTAAGGCRPRCCRPGSPTPQPPAATSPS